MRIFFHGPLGKVIRHGIPWGIAALIFFFLFREYPPAQILSALRHVNIGLFAALAVGYFFYVLFVDTIGTARVFSRFTKRIETKDLIISRAATYPLSVLNYGAGQAAFAYYIHRKKRVSLADVFGIFFLIIAIDFYWIIGLAFIGTLIHGYELGGFPIGPIIRPIAFIALIALLLHLVFWRLGHKELAARLPFWNRLGRWLERRHLVRIFREATLKDYCLLALTRLPIHAMFPVVFYSIILLFGAHIPFRHVVGTVPIVILIGTIPITPGGLGTANAAFVQMLSPFISGAEAIPAKELIFAMSLLWMFTNYFLKVLFGSIALAFMPK